MSVGVEDSYLDGYATCFFDKDTMDSCYKKVTRNKSFVYDVLEKNYSSSSAMSKFANQYAITTALLMTETRMNAPIIEDETWSSFVIEFKSFLSFLFYAKTRTEEFDEIPVDQLKEAFCVVDQERFDSILSHYYEISFNDPSIEGWKEAAYPEYNYTFEVGKYVYNQSSLSKAVKNAVIWFMQNIYQNYGHIVRADEANYRALFWTVCYLLDLRSPKKNTFKANEQIFQSYLNESAEKNEEELQREYNYLLMNKKWYQSKPVEYSYVPRFYMPSDEFKIRTEYIKIFMSELINSFESIDREVAIFSTSFCIAMGMVFATENVQANKGGCFYKKGKAYYSPARYYDRKDLLCRLIRFIEEHFKLKKNLMDIILDRYAAYSSSDVSPYDNWSLQYGIPFVFDSPKRKSLGTRQQALIMFFSDIFGSYASHLEREGRSLSTDVLIKAYLATLLASETVEPRKAHVFLNGVEPSYFF